MTPQPKSKPEEKGAIRKPQGSLLPIALVYPNTYSLGMANLGFQFLYGLLNGDPAFSAERFFFPGFPGDPHTTLNEPRSQEWDTPLSRFPLIAFSIPFENDYPAVPAMLSAAGIPPLQKDRGPHDPIVIAGGVSVTINPEPLSPFLDIVFMGEVQDEIGAEERDFFSVIEQLLGDSSQPVADRGEFLAHFKDVPSVYVPSAYRFHFHDNGLIQTIEPQNGFPQRVRAAKRRSPSGTVPVSVLFSPDAEFGDSLLVETNRGCGRGCRFCAAGWIHFPVRHAPFERFRDQVEAAVRDGRNVGLIGSDLAGHSQLEEILETIVDRGGKFSLSSIRPEGLTPRVIELIAGTGQKTATLAPEVASPRLKAVVGKEIPSERFYELVEQLVSAGIPNVRYYFMIGLPTETDEDIEHIVDFVRQSRKIFVDASRLLGRIGRIGVQVNPFVPKPWTPFQWAPMAGAKELERRISILRKALGKEPNVVLRIESARHALYQSILSRGDRRLAPVLLRVAEQQGRWSGALKREGVDPDFYARRERDADETFPWDIVDHGVSKQTLRQIYDKALAKVHDMRDE
ncbi:radical SAM protein [Thermodesulfobacteriota bacterium]